MQIIDNTYNRFAITNPIWCNYFFNAPPQRQGEMVESIIFRKLQPVFTPFDAGFKTTFDGFDSAIDIDRDEANRLRVQKYLPNVAIYEDYMENNIFGEARTNEVLVDIKYTSKPDFDGHFYGLTDLQKQFAATQHCRWIQCTAPLVSRWYVEIEYRIIDTIPSE